MINVNRREVLKALAALGVSSCLPSAFGLRNLAFAADDKQPILVVMHIRGGWDGLNLISPANDLDFIAARQTELRVLTEGKDAGYPLANAMTDTIDFRLHNAAGGWAELYNNNNLAFIHACGLADGTRSHFVATDMIETGVGTQVDLMRQTNGWITRSIKAQGRSVSALDAVALSNGFAGDLRGLHNALATLDVNNGLPPMGGASVSSMLWQMYENRNDELGEAGRLAIQLPMNIDQRILRDEHNRVLPYVPENGANYDKAGSSAIPFKSIARLIKMDLGLQAITMDYGMWDTHDNQPGRFRTLLEPLSNGMAAFWNDINAYHDKVVVVLLSEFGRRLRNNKSNGTDHGRGGVMAVLGGQVKGGKIYGNWPGLGFAQLDEGVDLAVTTDYRQVLAETLEHIGGRKAADIFPSFKIGNRLGLFDESA